MNEQPDDSKGTDYAVPGFCSTPVRRMFRRAYAVARLGYPIDGVVWAERAARRAASLAQKQVYDAILSRCMPGYGHLPAMRLSRHMRVPWIANWNDPWPEAKCPRPYGLGAESRIGWGNSLFLHAVSRAAWWHTFPCERLRRYMLRYLPHEVRLKSSVIPHPAVSELARSSGPQDSMFTLCYVGALDVTARRPEVFFRGLRIFLDRHKCSHMIKAVFVGAHSPAVQEMAVSCGVSNVVEWRGLRGYGECQRLQAAAHALVSIEAPLAEGIFLPSKVSDQIQARRPVLALSPREGTLADMISAHGGGICVDCTDPWAVAAAIGRLYEAWTRNTLERDFPSEQLYEQFAAERVLRLYRKLFTRLLGAV